MSAGELTGWVVLSASVRGSAHDRTGMPNQDAVDVRCDRDDRVAILALSDGHGSHECFRSDIGARIAVELTLDRAGELVEPACTSVATLQTALPTWIEALTTEWATRVRAHVGENPFAPAELAGMRDPDDVLRPYGATLLIAVATDVAVGLVQLGDGDIALLDMSGRVARPIEVDTRLAAGETTSLCLPDAHRYTRHAVIDAKGTPIAVLLLASDGYGNAFEDSSWHHEVLPDFAHHLHDHGAEWVQARLPDWLADSARVGGDDVSVAVLAPIVMPLVPVVRIGGALPARPPITLEPKTALVVSITADDPSNPKLRRQRPRR